MQTVSVSRGMMLGHMRNVKQKIESGQIIEPHRMYDPGLIHPYPGQPPSGREVLADIVRLEGRLELYPQPSCGDIKAAMAKDAGAHRNKSIIWAGVATVLALGAGAAALFGPAASGVSSLAHAALPGAAAVGTAALAIKENRAGHELTQVAAQVAGWESNIRDSNGLFPIPEENVVPFEYVQYCEGIAISRSRRARFS